METTTEKPSLIPAVAKQMDSTVLSVMGSNTLKGFERAYMIAHATNELQELLTPEYMQPIMKLQGTKIGFRTDKDSSGGYPEMTVKKCLIEAVLFGLQPVGNQFNIIAGNMYPTKEGLGYVLSQIPGLCYTIIPSLPRINAEKSSAAIDMTVRWSIGGGKKEEVVPIPIRINNGMGTDAIIGKATRKARAWLYSTITGNEIGEGDVTDTDAVVISSTPTKTAEQHEVERVKLLLEKCKTVDEVQKLQVACPEMDVKIFTDKIAELGGHKQ